MFFTAHVLSILSLVKLKTEGTNIINRKTTPKSYETELKILANLGLA